MKRTLPPLLLLVLAGLAAGGLTFAEEEAEPAFVKAQHYRMVYAQSGLDLSHGGGQWVHGLFLPEAKVAAMFVYDTEWTGEPQLTFTTLAKLYAYPAEKPQNHLTGLGGKPTEIEEIEIPAELAKQIVKLAELTARHKAETRRLGSTIEKTLGWKAIPTGN